MWICCRNVYVLPAVNDDRAGSTSVTFIHLPKQQELRIVKREEEEGQEQVLYYEPIYYKVSNISPYLNMYQMYKYNL